MRLTTPWAVLIGVLLSGVFVAIAVFLALRPREKEGEGAAEVSVRAPGAPELPPPAVTTPRLPGSASLVEAEGAVADARRALASQHDALVRACCPVEGGASASAHYSVALHFDGSGRQSTKAMLTEMGRPNARITECLARNLAPITIVPANAPASVDVPLVLP